MCIRDRTYTTSDGSVAHTNPIRLDSAGRPPSGVFLQLLPYKFVLALPEDTDPPTSPLRTEDNVNAVPALSEGTDIAGVSGEGLTATDLVYLSAGDGGRTSARWYKADADLDYGSLRARELGFVMN